MIPSVSPEELQRRFGLDGAVGFEPGAGGLPRAVVNAQGAAAEVYCHGAHVAHWQPAGCAPVFWLSGQSWFEPHKPIRGGVPVCLPWFGSKAGDPAAPGHGFARLNTWRLVRTRRNDDDSVSLTFVLPIAANDSPHWSHDAEFCHVITVGEAMVMRLEVSNTDRTSFVFSEALHSYFTVSDVRQIAITGLEGARYHSAVENVTDQQQDGAVLFTRETDRIYTNTTAACVIDDPGLGRRIRITKSGSQSTVVWNPWTAKAKAMPDFGDDEWPGMVCVETANAAENQVTLAPGQTHVMTARVEVE